jgi:hypothetical protein
MSNEQGEKAMNILSNENFDLLLKTAAVTMPTKIHKTIEMAEAGELSGSVASRVFNHLAGERYPGNPLAISKFMADEDGGRLNNALVRAERAAKIQHYNPASEQTPAPQPSVEKPSDEPTHNAQNKFANAAQEMAVAHANQNKFSIHHAYDDLLKNSQYFRLLLAAAKGNPAGAKGGGE